MIDRYFRWNEIEEISPVRLGGSWPKLKILKLNHNKLKQFTNISQFKALSTLVLNDNEIKDIPLELTDLSLQVRFKKYFSPIPQFR